MASGLERRCGLFFAWRTWNPLGSTRSPCGSIVLVGRAPQGLGERTGFEKHEGATPSVSTRVNQPNEE